MTASSRAGGDGLRYAVALIEIQGGLVGLWIFLTDLGAVVSGLTTSLLLGIAIIGLVLGASVVAGVALWHDRRLGLVLSVPVQLAQLVWIASDYLTFRVNASGWLLADLFVRRSAEGGTAIGWQFDVAAKAGYAFSLAPRQDLTVALNLIAAAILCWLALRLRHGIGEERGRRAA